MTIPCERKSLYVNREKGRGDPSFRHARAARPARQYPEFESALRRARCAQLHRVCHADAKVTLIGYHVANAVAEIIAHPGQGFGLRRHGWAVEAPQIATVTG